MKMIIKSIYLLVLILIVSSTGTIAKERGSLIQPYNLYTEEVWGDISISNNGIATVKARCISSASNIKKINLHVYLQKYVNEEWTSIQYWPASSQTRTCTLNKSTEVIHGYSYRVKVSSYVMTTDDSEQIVIYTGSKWY